MLVKIIEYRELTESIERPEDLEWTLQCLNIDVNQIDSLVMQIEKYGITWDTTNVRYSFYDCGYGYLPVNEDDSQNFYFKIRLKNEC